MASLAAEIIKLARSQVGYREGYSNGHWNNNQKYSDQVPGMDWSDYQAWCQTFQSWLAWKTDSPEPRTASCWTACNWFKERGRFSEYPAIGAQVFFGAGGGSHVGRVYAYDETYAYTIEGNTNDSGSAEGNGVYLKKRRRRDSYLHGYGMPDFPEGVTTADPRLRGKDGYIYRTTADGPVGEYEEDPLSGYSKKDIAEAFLKTDGVFDAPARWRNPGSTNEHWQYETATHFIGDRALEASEGVAALRKEVAELTELVKALDLSAIAEQLESLRITARLDVTE